ncbi:TetR/AcrR family transcriptional regulator [Sphaerochaeta globosa]|uniref:Transcriptional regulator, TetR family n=1 Tax=Sphaerochaeta globosa (strain ATCC BAA-1886 / DSM 22777 / Buddy) TaxID=158189 RepID=F0RU10_SPHGB|nr:TetR/AcrR family transcriptional regulator [Sphaerochaeta globosa]ADY13869.1 transcriptional regulator, TetR family [Sphaerochaeta globosa str. Buddy]
MGKRSYHHGSLENDLIHKGLQLLTTVGLEAFSLRKVAALCGVSNTAPYRHFSSKQALIIAITTRVSTEFTCALDSVVHQYEGDRKKQIIQASTLYVSFMVEHPEHFKCIFMMDHTRPLFIKEGTFTEPDRYIVSMFKMLFGGLGEEHTMDALAVWSLVHGFTAMLVNKTLVYEGSYTDAVEAMVKKLCFFSPSGIHGSPIDDESIHTEFGDKVDHHGPTQDDVV